MTLKYLKSAQASSMQMHFKDVTPTIRANIHTVEPRFCDRRFNDQYSRFNDQPSVSCKQLQMHFKDVTPTIRANIHTVEPRFYDR